MPSATKKLKTENNKAVAKISLRKEREMTPRFNVPAQRSAEPDLPVKQRPKKKERAEKKRQTPAP